MKELKLSSKICPRCGCDSLSEAYHEGNVLLDKNYTCLAGCGMEFGLNRAGNNKIKLHYNDDNAEYLKKRFKYKKNASKPII